MEGTVPPSTQDNYAIITTIIAFIILLLFASRILKSSEPKANNQISKKVSEEKVHKVEEKAIEVTDKVVAKEENNSSVIQNVKILYGTTTGTSRTFAFKLSAKLKRECNIETTIIEMKDYDLDLLESEKTLILIASTWLDGTPPATSVSFFDAVIDLSNDFRVSKAMLERAKIAFFGLGSSEYDENFCKAIRDLEQAFLSLGALKIMETGLADDTADQITAFNNWTDRLIMQLKNPSSLNSMDCTSNEDCSCKNDKKSNCKSTNTNARTSDNNEVELTAEDLINEQAMMEADWQSNEEEEEEEENSNYGNDDEEKDELVDVEDLGKILSEQKSKSTMTTSLQEMVTPLQRKALTKEGYKIIGSHSAVKLCRWTKNMLRGRGGCYKYTFYGIISYQCMETTPSLACANKCVFCWRHHKNPVGKEWRWVTDDPNVIVREAIEKHQRMINEMKGAKGVDKKRWEEAFTVRHCALSLVGEPIMYPRINELVRDLHSRGISSFLVTNAQFPESIASLEPVTQLYVSIDAATKDSLKAVDRPLFKDFWERFLSSLQELKRKQQRTVYRLTLVKGWNMTEIEEYTKLISIGEPDLIEIKAVTYCGTSDASNLTMQNVPWHYEVCTFAQALGERTNGDYTLAVAHAHSCCTLLAHKKFFKDGKWHTWIDYNKFHQLMQQYYQNGTTFTTEDYMAETPSWALYGSSEEGFSPNETRFFRNKSGKIIEDQYIASESGCG